MSLSLALRQRAQAAGLLEAQGRLRAGERFAEDMVALAHGPLTLLASAAATQDPAAIVGVLPVRVGSDVAEAVRTALSHRAAAEAEVIDLSVPAPATMGALDLVCEVARHLLAALPGAVARIDDESLRTLATGANVDTEGAAARLRSAGVTDLLASADAGPLRAMVPITVPAVIDARFVTELLASPRRAVVLRGAPGATGIALLRGVALARLAGLGPITLRAEDELKGADAGLAFGADCLEAELDPPGTLGARTRAYGEAAVHGAQRLLSPARRRAAEVRRVPRILDEHVPAGLDGALTLTVLPTEEIRP